MMPTEKEIENDVESNFNRIFNDIKLSKKAEEKVKSVLKESITVKYKLHIIKKILDGLKPKKDDSTNA